jgi:hypothetical protein
LAKRSFIWFQIASSLVPFACAPLVCVFYIGGV